MMSSAINTHYGVLKEVPLPLVLLEEEDVVVLPGPGAVHFHNLLVVLQLTLCTREQDPTEPSYCLHVSK